MFDVYLEFSPLHKGTLATLLRTIPVRERPKNPFSKFGDPNYCTHYTTEFGADGFELDPYENDVRTYCERPRQRGPHAFLCEGHIKELFPVGKPKGWNPVVENMLDCRSLAVGEAKLIAEARRLNKVRSVKLPEAEPNVRLHRIGWLRTITTP